MDLITPLYQIITQTLITEYTLYDRNKKVYATAISEFILQTNSGFYAYQWQSGKFILNIDENCYCDETDLAITWDSHTPFFSKKVSVFDGFDNLPCELTAIEIMENGLCFIANGYDRLYLTVQPHSRQSNEHFSERQLILKKLLV